MKNKQIVLTQTGGPDMLQVQEKEVPQPVAGEVRIKVLAAGIAYAEVLMRQGLYPGAPKTPFTPGYEVVGQVEQTGPHAPADLIGRTVATLAPQGGYAQYAIALAERVMPVPAGVDSAEAVCLPLNYLTAWQLLHRQAKVKTGETMLVSGAAGGVGTALLQLGRLAGLQMVGLASPEKHDLVRSLGATPFDYHQADADRQIRLLYPKGLDVVSDFKGGQHFDRSFRLLRPGGRAVLYGLSDVKQNLMLHFAYFFILKMPLLNLFSGKEVSFYSVNSRVKSNLQEYREDLATLLGLLQQGQIKPVVAGRIPLEEVPRAHRLLEQHQATGKFVILPNR